MRFSSIRYALLALVIAASAATVAPHAAYAADKTAGQARTVSTDVFDLLVGGAWTHNKQSGYYRAIALASGKDGEGHAEIWLQWIVTDKKGARVGKSISIKEITALKLASLSLALDIEGESSVILVVSSYDETSGDAVTYEYRATTPGAYKALETQVASEQ